MQTKLKDAPELGPGLGPGPGADQEVRTRTVRFGDAFTAIRRGP
jgi:hypothetical protein